jgi:hypothetical protein
MGARRNVVQSVAAAHGKRYCHPLYRNNIFIYCAELPMLFSEPDRNTIGRYPYRNG